MPFFLFIKKKKNVIKKGIKEVKMNKIKFILFELMRNNNFNE